MKGKNTRKRAHSGRLRDHASTTAFARHGLEQCIGGFDLPEESHEAHARRQMLYNHALPSYGTPGPTPLVVNDFSFVTFPEEIDSKARSMLCTYFTYLKNTMYPIARYSRPDPANTYWFHWTQLDLAYLHSILFTASFFNDNLTGCKSKRTKYHSYRTVSELNKQLSDAKTALTDSTTTVVMAMALVAECFGDVDSAHMHVKGLRRIVELRGGIKSTGLVYSICTGAEPAFCEETPSYASAFDISPELLRLKPLDASYFSRSRTIVRALDRRLYNIFKDVQGLSQLLNNSSDCGHKIQDMALEELLTSVQSRLLTLKFNEHGNNIAELLRLSLMAYLTTVFWCFPGLKFDYPHLAMQFRRACLAFSPTTASEKHHFAWALTVGAISLFQAHNQDWLLRILHPLIRHHLGTTWVEVKKSLGHIMWIGSIHDCSASELFSHYLGEPGAKDILVVGSA
ncbi:hypothetical protein CT0861_11559 [Colletotrichum tofieldiae]|uniref:Uncharacterized protein n=1 Tax=Colletotrichum tofieldiae TaxID=708197 RepID=A0A166W5P5_9PEZI|nr:hypothetical protein CT0861_11559 [Colletotrichum tofieldiae]